MNHISEHFYLQYYTLFVFSIPFSWGDDFTVVPLSTLHTWGSCSNLVCWENSKWHIKDSTLVPLPLLALSTVDAFTLGLVPGWLLFCSKPYPTASWSPHAQFYITVALFSELVYFLLLWVLLFAWCLSYGTHYKFHQKHSSLINYHYFIIALSMSNWTPVLIHGWFKITQLCSVCFDLCLTLRIVWFLF